VARGSHKTWPNGMSTCSSSGCQRSHSASGSAASNKLFLGSAETDIPDLLSGVYEPAIVVPEISTLRPISAKGKS
jgi:hypothetical protein